MGNRDFMNTKSFMIITEVGYFLAHDAIDGEMDYIIKCFKDDYQFKTVIDIIEEPYDSVFHKHTEKLDLAFENGDIDEDTYNEEHDRLFTRIEDINKNAVSSLNFDSQM